MIIALEGADGAGKTTLFKLLQDYFMPAFFGHRLIFVTYPPLGTLWTRIADVEAREANVFEQMYDPNAIYVMDRFFAVSGPVYAMVFDRPAVDYAKWLPMTWVIHLWATQHDLERRIAQRGDDQIAIVERLPQVVKAYDEILNKWEYNVCRVNASTRHPVSIDYTEYVSKLVIMRIKALLALRA